MANKPCAICGATTHVAINNKKLQCNKCNTPDLHWGNANTGGEKYRRYHPNGADHVCGRVPVATNGDKDDSTPVVPAESSSAEVETVTPAAPPVTDEKVKFIEDELAIMRATLANAEQKQDLILQGLGQIPTKDTFKLFEEKEADIQQRFDVLQQARPISITVPGKATVDVGRQHVMFQNVLAALMAVRGTGVPFLIGEPGSFKTAVVFGLAKAMGLNAEVQPVGQQTSKSDLIGYNSASGAYVDSAIARVYRNGGICLIDEIDAANSNVLTIINSVLANDHAGFPDGMFPRHPDCHFIVAGNTFGRGADVQFVGRAQLDQATLNRFVYIPFDTDWDLVSHITGVPIKAEASKYPAPGTARPLTDPLIQQWGQFVKDVHDVIEREGIRAAVGSRAAMNGVKMLAAGMDYEFVKYSTVIAHLNADQWDTVQAHLKVAPAPELKAQYTGKGEWGLTLSNIHSKIEVIRVVRNLTGAPLKEAKDFVEGENPSMRFETEEARRQAKLSFLKGAAVTEWRDSDVKEDSA